MKQGTEEWKLARAGKITASRMGDLLAKTKSGASASRRNYLAELVVERMTGTPSEHFVSKEMVRGTELEPEARTMFEFLFDVTVEEVGFIVHPTMPFTGGSPDGLVGEEGLIEIKCPNTATHIDTLCNGRVPTGYYKQIQWCLECTERHWAEFVTYDPRMDERLALFTIHVPRDEAFLKMAREEVAIAEAEIQQTIEELSALAESRGIA